MRVGYSRSVITPPIGTFMAGYAARTKPSIGVHDELYVRAIYVEDGEEKFISLALDILGVDVELASRISEIISKELPIEREKIMISATHTHAGPDIQGDYSQIRNYLREYIVDACCGAAMAAYNDLREVSVVQGVGSVEGITVNRRNPVKGSVDPRLHVIGFRVGRCPYAAIINFTCHAVVLGHNNLYISADYPGTLNKYVEILTGAKSLFLNGTCGDINPYTPGTDLNRVYDRSVGTFDDVEWMGKILACEAVKTMLLREAEDGRLYIRAKKLRIGVRKPYTLSEAEEMLRRAEEKYKEAQKSGDSKKIIEASYERWLARKTYDTLKIYKDIDAIETWMGAVSFSPSCAMVFLPSEIVVKVGLEIKRRSPFENTVVVAYTNGYFGYIPMLDEYEKGGYETIFPVSIVEKGTGEKLIDEAISLLMHLRSLY